MNIKGLFSVFLASVLLQPLLWSMSNPGTPPPIPPKPQQFASQLVSPAENEQKQEVYAIAIENVAEEQQEKTTESDADALLAQGQAPFVTRVLDIVTTAQQKLYKDNKVSDELFNVYKAVINSNRIQLMLQKLAADAKETISEQQSDEAALALQQLRDSLIELRTANNEHATILDEDNFIIVEQGLIDLENALQQTLITVQARDDKNIYRKMLNKVSATVKNMCTNCSVSANSCKQTAYALTHPQTWRNKTAQNTTFACNILTQAFLLGAKIAQANQNDTAVVANSCLALLSASATGAITTAQRCFAGPRSQAQQFSPGLARFNVLASSAGMASSLLSLSLAAKAD